MEKIHVVLVSMNKNSLTNTFSILNFDKVEIDAVFSDEINRGGGTLIHNVRGYEIQFLPLKNIQYFLRSNGNFIWLLCGFKNRVDDFERIKKFLMANAIAEKNILNFDIVENLSEKWIGNIRYIEKNSVNYFVTGDSYMQTDLNLEKITDVKGINLSAEKQDLRQSYLTAKYVFDHVERDKIKFVLIGLTPFSFRYENAKDFSEGNKNFQYIWTLKNSSDDQNLLLKNLLRDEIQNLPLQINESFADPNYKIKKSSETINIDSLINYEDELKNQHKKFSTEVFERNLKILEDFIKLCLENNAKPVAVICPFISVIHDNYDQDMLFEFNKTLEFLQKIYDFKIIDLFHWQPNYEFWHDMTHLNLKGANCLTAYINFKLRHFEILSQNYILNMAYSSFYDFAQVVDANFYNQLMDSVFNFSIKKIAMKNKIKIGFVMWDSAMWCGDDLYNLFATNERYETTVFLYLRNDQKVVEKNSQSGLEKFKSHGINIVDVAFDDEIPKQDVLIYLLPYFEMLPKAFQSENLTVETLIAYIPYGMDTDYWPLIYGIPMYFLMWKMFFETRENLINHANGCRIGMPRGIYSGYPKLDIFFKENNLSYDWKMTRADSKKIIWAPHWSINSGLRYSTFQHNYQFFYEYAKAHPEISFVVKPHPHLLTYAVTEGIFKSNEEFEEYLHKWNELPNAKVETGNYYQSIFATSDAMILDSSSFIAEYQYTHKPMLFLTRDTQKFNDLGNELMKILYRVDGRDFEGIEKFIDEVVINEKDEFYDERMKFFDEHFNYKKINGMLASEFIFNEIDKNFR